MVIRVELFLHKPCQRHANWDCIVSHRGLCYSRLLSCRACGWIARLLLPWQLGLSRLRDTTPRCTYLINTYLWCFFYLDGRWDWRGLQNHLPQWLLYRLLYRLLLWHGFHDNLPLNIDLWLDFCSITKAETELHITEITECGLNST